MTVQRFASIFIDFARQYNDLHRFSIKNTIVQRFLSILCDDARQHTEFLGFAKNIENPLVVVRFWP